MKRPTLEVHIAPLRDRPGAYVASWANEILGSVYRLAFPDMVIGAVALHTFAEMLQSRYPDSRVVFLLSDKAGAHPEGALRDALVLNGHRHNEPVVSLF